METVSFDDVRRRVARGELVALLHDLPAPTAWNFSGAAVPSAPRLITAGVETVLWDFARGERLADFRLGGRDVVVDPSGERAYVGTEEGVVWALDLARGADGPRDVSRMRAKGAHGHPAGRRSWGRCSGR